MDGAEHNDYIDFSSLHARAELDNEDQEKNRIQSLRSFFDLKGFLILATGESFLIFFWLKPD